MLPLAASIFVYESLSAGIGSHGRGDAPGLDMLAMGEAMRDAVVADLLALKIYHVCVATAKADAPAPAHGVAPRDGEAAADFVRRHARAHDLVWAIAPETADELAGLHDCARPEQWIGCEPRAIRLATRKHATLAALAAAGLATPLAFEHAAQIERWVVKPDDGAGAIATRVHRQRPSAWNDWHARTGAGDAAVMEPWIEGEPLSLSLLCGRTHCELLSIDRQQLHVGPDGSLSFLGVQVQAVPLTDARAAVLAALATRVHRAMPGLRGFVGVDLVWHPAYGPVVIEVNPRVTCAYVGLSRALGRNLAGDAIAAASSAPRTACSDA